MGIPSLEERGHFLIRESFGQNRGYCSHDACTLRLDQRTLEKSSLPLGTEQAKAALKYLYSWLRHSPKYGKHLPPADQPESLYYADVHETTHSELRLGATQANSVQRLDDIGLSAGPLRFEKPELWCVLMGKTWVSVMPTSCAIHENDMI
nr:peroxisome biogenesis protein 5 [Ipomoea batatas]